MQGSAFFTLGFFCVLYGWTIPGTFGVCIEGSYFKIAESTNARDITRSLLQTRRKADRRQVPALFRPGFALEVYGFWRLFSAFFPTVLSFLRRMPFLRRILDLPAFKKVRLASGCSTTGLGYDVELGWALTLTF